MKIPSLFRKLQLEDLSISEKWVQYSYCFLYAMLGALLISILNIFIEKPTPQLGTINITGIIDQFIKQEAQQNLAPEILKKEVENFGLRLNNEIQSFSYRNHLILFPSEAVIAGAPDYTGFIKQRIQSTLKDKPE